MAPIAVRALIAFLPVDSAANNLHAHVDTRLLLFAFLVSLLTGFLAGSAPALQAAANRWIPRSGSGRHTIRRLGTTQGDCDAQIAFTLILVSRRFVSEPLRAVGKRSGV